MLVAAFGGKASRVASQCGSPLLEAVHVHGSSHATSCMTTFAPQEVSDSAFLLQRCFRVLGFKSLAHIRVMCCQTPTKQTAINRQIHSHDQIIATG